MEISAHENFATPTLFSVHEPIESYLDAVQTARGGRADGDRAALPLGAIDFFLLHQWIAQYALRPRVLDLAAEVTLGASTLFFLGNPQVREVQVLPPAERAAGTPDWRPLLEAAVADRQLSPPTPYTVLRASRVGEIGRCFRDNELRPPLLVLLHVNEKESRESLENTLQELLALQEDVVVAVCPLGRIGRCGVLASLIAHSAAHEEHRLAALREICPFTATARLGILYRTFELECRRDARPPGALVRRQFPVPVADAGIDGTPPCRGKLPSQAGPRRRTPAKPGLAGVPAGPARPAAFPAARQSPRVVRSRDLAGRIRRQDRAAFDGREVPQGGMTRQPTLRPIGMQVNPPRILAVLPGLIPSTVIGVVKPLVRLHEAGRIRARITLEWLVRRQEVERADMLIFCRNTVPERSAALDAAVSCGIPFLYDIDDNLFDLPADDDQERQFPRGGVFGHAQPLSDFGEPGAGLFTAHVGKGPQSQSQRRAGLRSRRPAADSRSGPPLGLRGQNRLRDQSAGRSIV